MTDNTPYIMYFTGFILLIALCVAHGLWCWWKCEKEVTDYVEENEED